VADLHWLRVGSLFLGKFFSTGARLGGLSMDHWREALDVIGEERGYFSRLGDRHMAIFTDQGSTLLVTFETADQVRERPGALPQGFGLADPRGWSQLCVLAEGPTWFRDPRVFGYFDRLVDDGFFEDFDRVIFHGAGMCGYAACAFSVAAPGATVIAVAPQATLDPRRAGWDRRHLSARRLAFDDRYGFAPRMLDAADRAFILFDPDVTEDAIHAAMFTGENADLIRCRHFGADIAEDMERLDILGGLLDLAGQGTLRAIDFHRALRARHRHVPWLRALVTRLETKGDWMRLGLVTRHLSERYGGRRFQRTHSLALEKLAAEGRSLPAARRPATA